MLKKPNNYENVQLNEDFIAIELGGHKGVIKNAEVYTSEFSGKTSLKVCVDTAKDDKQPEYFAELYKNDDRENKKWSSSAIRYVSLGIFDRRDYVTQRIRHAHDGGVRACDALLRLEDGILDQAKCLGPVGEAIGHGFADRLQLRIKVRQRAAHRFLQFPYHHFYRVAEAFDRRLDQGLFILAVGEAVLYSLLNQAQVGVEASLLVRQCPLFGVILKTQLFTEILFQE